MGLFDGILDNPQAMGLLAMGANMLANNGTRPYQTPWQSLGDGLLGGMQAAHQMKRQHREDEYMKRRYDMYDKEFALKERELQDKLAERENTRQRLASMRSSPGVLGFGVPLNAPQAQTLLSDRTGDADFDQALLRSTNEALEYSNPGSPVPIEAPRLGVFGQAAKMPGLPPAVAQLMSANQEALDSGAYKDPKDVADSFDKTMQFGLSLADRQQARIENNQMRKDLADQADQTRRDIAAQNIAVRRDISNASRANRPTPFTIVEDADGNKFWADSRNPSAPAIPVVGPDGAPVKKQNRDKLQQDAIALYNTLYPISMMGQRSPGAPNPTTFINDYIAKRNRIPQKSPGRKAFNPATGRIE